MATVLCVWEQGTSLGHLSTLRLPIALALAQGHRVYLAARELDRAHLVLGDLPVALLQAPFKQNVQAADQSAFLGYTHLIARQCFSGPDELMMYARAWQSIFDLVKPDLVLFEHSPTALIASRPYHFKRVLIGSGFLIPPQPTAPDDPFAPFVTTPRSPTVWSALRADERQLLDSINQVTQRLGGRGFDRLSDVYAQADARFLMTWPVLDHFGARSAECYLGVESPAARPLPRWPTGPGIRVFGYLRLIPSLERLLQDLQDSGVCALLYVHDLPLAMRQAWSHERMQFTGDLVDLTAVSNQAAWVISHGNHNTLAAFVQAGVAQLVIPTHQEQLFAALRLVDAGSAVMAYQDQPGYGHEIAALLLKPAFAQRAKLMAQDCAAQPSTRAADHISATFKTLLG